MRLIYTLANKLQSINAVCWVLWELSIRYFLHNAFAFYRKQILIDNPFDETLSTKEDRYWINDMIERGGKSYYNSDTICHHHYTDNGATWKGIG